MATWDDVRRVALALPETAEGSSHGFTAWKFKNKGFVWERPLRQAELAALGSSVPDGPILGVHVEHVGLKEAHLAENPDVFFTTPHFDGYAAVLVRLDRIAVPDLDELIVDAWLSRAPKRLARDYLERSRSS
ncbi:MAG: MmcQ/YjbR family DNA-binding protein [Chloroflexota bacterium]